MHSTTTALNRAALYDRKCIWVALNRIELPPVFEREVAQGGLF
jgi:hypothetical protein